MRGHTPGPWLNDCADSRTVYALTPDGKQNRFWVSVQSVCRVALGEATQSECIANAHASISFSHWCTDKYANDARDAFRAAARAEVEFLRGLLPTTGGAE